MITLSCAIIDDEPLALDLLESYIKKTPMLHLIGRYSNGLQAMYDLESTPVDLIFLDIQMPEISGIELARRFGENVKIIFTTAFSQYAIEGYKVNALDYLLKPITYSDFLQSVGKAVTWYEIKTDANRFRLTLEEEIQNPIDENCIFVRSERRLVKIDLSKVLYIEGMKNYARIFLENQENPIVTISTLKSLVEFLPSDRFLRVQRSYIVQISKIRIIKNNFIVFGNFEVPIGEAYRDEFEKYLKNKRPE